MTAVLTKVIARMKNQAVFWLAVSTGCVYLNMISVPQNHASLGGGRTRITLIWCNRCEGHCCSLGFLQRSVASYEELNSLKPTYNLTYFKTCKKSQAPKDRSSNASVSATRKTSSPKVTQQNTETFLFYKR